MDSLDSVVKVNPHSQCQCQRVISASTITITQDDQIMKDYSIVNDQGFDAESLHAGEIGLEIQPKFVERDNKGSPIIELTGKLFWAADEENQAHLGKDLKWAIFFGANQSQTPRILKDLFKKAGFETGKWIARDFRKEPMTRAELNDGCMEFGNALAGSIKLLAVKRVPILFKVQASTRDGSTRNFLNPVKILRASPNDGTEYSDALPEPVTNAMVLEAYNAVLEGENVNAMV